MDEGEDDARYNSNSAGGEDSKEGSADRDKGPVREVTITRLNSEYEAESENGDEDEEDPLEDEDDSGDEDDEGDNGVERIGDVAVNDGKKQENGVAILAKEKTGDFKRKVEEIDYERHPKKRRNLVSNYEFAPRVAQAQSSAIVVAAKPTIAAAPITPAVPKQSYGGRNPLADWTEHETFVLLDAWGDRFLQHGRKSLRSEEWQEVADKVSSESKIERTDTQCRNRLDTLKKKYKKEKAKFGAAGAQSSKWIYFKKMDVLMSPPPKQTGLSCGVDSGEFVFMDPRVHLNRANGLNQIKDSPGHSDSTEDEADDSDGLPPMRKRPAKIINNISNSNNNNSSRRIIKDEQRSPLKLLADSLQNFSKIYEKIEGNKRQQMLELEKMRMDFHRDLEQEKKQILERAQTEIAKIWQGDDEENGTSAENISS